MATQQQPLDMMAQAWVAAQPTGTTQQYHQGIQTHMLDFFHEHPHMIALLARRNEELITKLFHRYEVESGKLDERMFQIEVWKQMFAQGAEQADVLAQLEAMEAVIAHQKLLGTPKLINDEITGKERDQMVWETLDFTSAAFLEGLTDEQQQEINNLHQENHDWAISQGQYHYSGPQQQPNAIYTQYGQTYNTPQGHVYQPQYTNQYGQPGHPQQQPPGYYQQPTIRQAAFGAGLDWLTGGNN